MYWAEELANQNEDEELKNQFEEVAKYLKENEEKIMKDLIDCQGKPQDINGYYWPDEDKVYKAMRPSETLNKVIDELLK